VAVANVGIHSTPTASHTPHLSTASPCLSAPRSELRSARELDGMAWRPNPRHISLKASLGTWLGSAPFRCRSTRAGQLRGSPRKTALRARATRSRRRFFAVLKTALDRVARALADDETVLRFGNFRGFAPTGFSVLVRDEAAYKTLKFQRLPRSFRWRYRRISLVAHPQFAR